jgi:hypothetical protein
MCCAIRGDRRAQRAAECQVRPLITAGTCRLSISRAPADTPMQPRAHCQRERNCEEVFDLVSAQERLFCIRRRREDVILG